jgi:hypothetical protein
VVEAATDDQSRMALLWHAFEEAEQRIRELENELDRTRGARPAAFAPTAPAAGPAMVPEADLAACQSELASERAIAAKLREEMEGARAGLRDAELRIVALAAEIDAHVHAVARLDAELAHARRSDLAMLDRAIQAETASAAWHQTAASVRTQNFEMERRMTELERLAAVAAAEKMAAEERVEEAHARATDAATAASSELARERFLLRDVEDRLDASERERESLADLLHRERVESGRLAARLSEASEELSAAQTQAASAERLRVILADADEALDEAHDRERWLRAEIARGGFHRVDPRPIATGRIDALPGIRPEDVQRLREVGVNLLDPFLYADVSALAIATGIPLVRLARMHVLAQFMTLPEVTGEEADALYRMGRRSVGEIQPEDRDAIRAGQPALPTSAGPSGPPVGLWVTAKGRVARESGTDPLVAGEEPESLLGTFFRLLTRDAFR